MENYTEVVLGKFETYIILLFLFPPALVMRSVQPSLRHCQEMVSDSTCWTERTREPPEDFGTCLSAFCCSCECEKDNKIGNENGSMVYAVD